jgi:hypothetical protein
VISLFLEYLLRLMPVILATQEAEIRRIAVQSQKPYLEKPFPKKVWWNGSRCRP